METELETKTYEDIKQWLQENNYNLQQTNLSDKFDIEAKKKSSGEYIFIKVFDTVQHNHAQNLIDADKLRQDLGNIRVVGLFKINNSRYNLYEYFSDRVVCVRCDDTLKPCLFHKFVHKRQMYTDANLS